MRVIHYCAMLSISAMLLGCAAPVTRVILLPEASGRTSSVEVKTRAGTLTLSQAYQSAEVDAAGQLTPIDMNPLEVIDRYGGMLAQLPAADEQFMLYFEPGGSNLTQASQVLLPKILLRAKARKGGEIVVIGHTDRVGAVPANDALSLKRAQSIRDLLIAQSFKPELIEAIGRGERAPLVPTADEVDEPKNRRAEVLVR
jgi:outer membrane protein OmpA-like peptidoglycan-associated protein